MRFPIRLLAIAVLSSAAVFGNAPLIGEPGLRAHRSRLSAGDFHTCAILDDGTVECWGRNNYGQLGDGTTITRLSPVPVSGLGTVVSIAAGSSHTCAILSNGTVRCWGFNDTGQLGNNTTTSSAVPVPVTGLTSVVALAARFTNTCAVRVDGSVWCWGAALVSTSPSASAVPVQTPIVGAISVTVGAGHACALLASSTVRCWGQNTYGELGDFDNITSTTPRKALSLGEAGLLYDVNFGLEVSAGSNFTCSWWQSYMVCWGDNSFNQFGLPVSNPPAARNYADYVFWYQNVTAFATGAAHTCVIVAGGTVLCSGRNDAGQLGSPPPAAGPVKVPGVANAVVIAAGLKHTCAGIVDGTIRCWGDNSYGQLGAGFAGATPGVGSVPGISGGFLGRGIAAGNQVSCGRRGAGALACWGLGSQGQLGNADTVSSPNPVGVTGLVNAVSITTGSAHACLLDATGAAKCWGDNSRGQLGNGTTLSSSKPVPVQGGLSFSAISAGGLHTCGIAQNWIYCWGAAEETTWVGPDSLTPVKVYGLSNGSPLAAIATGSKFNCALFGDGTVDCWGGPPINQQSPKTVSAPGSTVAISAGANHACEVSVIGLVSCWGDNSRGQIGNNSTGSFAPGTAVSGITDAVSVSAGAFSTCVVHADGTASCWGANDSGELSTVDSADHLTPSPVGNYRFCLSLSCPSSRVFAPLQGVAEMAVGKSLSAPTQQQACALLASGVIDCWGNNAQGEVGDGTTINRAIPTAVNSFAANVDPAATLRNGRIAEVTALIDCESGGEAHILLTLEQGGITGYGQAEARCTGRLLRVPMSIPARGPSGFQPGAATAQVEAIVRDDDRLLEDTHWTRQVTLSISQ